MKHSRREITRLVRFEKWKAIIGTTYVFQNDPTALALGLGASLGTCYALTLCHRQPDTLDKLYMPVIDLSEPVRFKNPLASPPQHITVHPLEEWTLEVFVSLHLSTHSLEPVSALAAKQGTVSITIRNNYGNVLPLDVDLTQIVHETADRGGFPEAAGSSLTPLGRTRYRE